MASASNIIFKISIPSWDLHNATKKKNHRSFKLENRFFSDDKVSQLSAVQTRFYLYLLTVASDLNQSSYTLTTNSIPSYFRLRTHSIQSSLTKFESLQLLKYEKSPPNTREEKRIEENRREDKPKKENPADKSAAPISSGLKFPRPKNKQKTIGVEKYKQETLDFVKTWNSSEKVKKILTLNEDRKSKLAARFESEIFRAQWPAVITKIGLTPFLHGVNDKGWIADFDWVICNDKNYLKVLEGKYDNNSPPQKAPSSGKFQL